MIGKISMTVFGVALLTMVMPLVWFENSFNKLGKIVFTVTTYSIILGIAYLFLWRYY